MLTTQERLQSRLADRYTVERELGKGGMATVFLARDIRHDREVAIKVLHPELSASIGAERFEREIKLSAKLQHPHILGLIDSGEADGLLYYVMPFVKGEALRDRLDREGQLPIEDAIQIALEVADALGYAHTQGIIHRDIKPENILLSGGHALVADFGIARAATEAGAQKLTQTGMAVGTPVYMAPEQSVGDAVGPTSDLYSLGCVLYEMLAGEPPFTAKNPQALMARHAMEAVPSIRIIRNTVPEEVEDTIFAAMAKVPADRPQNAAQFAELLGMPLGATASRRANIRTTASRRIPTGASRTYQPDVTPWWRRPWVLVVAGVLVIGGALAAWRFGFAGTGKPRLSPSGLDPHRIAVLYFEDLSKDKQLGFVADGLTEALIGTLGQVQGLSVISKGGVEAFRAASVAPDSIARALTAGTLVRGSIEPEGARLRVNIRLVDGNSGADFDRASLNPPAADFLAVRDSAAQEVARLIRKRLGEEIKLREQRQGTRNAEAWALLQRASQLRKSGEAADSSARDRDFSAADSLLATAEQQDPKWPDPSVLRGFIAYRRSRLTRDRSAIQRWVDVGLGHVERALAMDANNADAFELRGNLRYWTLIVGLEPDAEKAKTLLSNAQADLELATRINPAQAGAWASLSHLYNRTGSGTDVNLAARRALEADAFLDNADVVLKRLFLSSYDLGNFPDARRWCDETKRRFPTSSNAPECDLFMLTTRAEQPDVARAWRLADSVKTLGGLRAEYLFLYARNLTAAVLARAGLADSARQVIERSKGNEDISPTRDLALVGAFASTTVGDKDKAIELLKLYFSANERMRAGYAEDSGWWFRPIADDPRFKQLVGAR